MSIVVAVRVSDGLVVATDSASTLTALTPEGSSGVAKVYNHATKLLQLKDYPIAVASWGMGIVGSRTVSSLIEEYANSRPSILLNEVEAVNISVRAEAEGLQEHLLSAFKEEHPEVDTENPNMGLGVLVGGYSGKQFFPEEFVFNVPKGEFDALREPGPGGKQDFGANWYGMTDACVRLHHGRDDRIPDILKEKGVDDDTIKEVMTEIQQKLQYPIPFNGMPLQDAVDYSMYMVGVVVGRFRFAVGAELCGGPIDVATITSQAGFQWIQRKELAARPFGPQI